ncbi:MULTISPECIES: carboxyltransferase domain-containing protein [unclassified Mycolicibacterium]|uniref:5-oxoprolinase subunit B family protein n=1 Tax=unclassified Mycolicibacterium TaxID=2636767 RepID=UPI001F4BEF69|nr:carboxyltransferase domain-containing protein [Mycolicibacterium sp. YH-1]UNB53026.1 carboxyltransferase domain-containing protein [Mycolicibacterium sp. YH-1]
MRSAPYQILHDGTRVSFGGDEFIFVEVGEAMDLAKALRIQAITTALAQTDVVGLVDIVPANASYMLRIEPELAEQRQLIGLMAELHQRFADSNAVTLDTEIVEIPVWYDDPWSAETCMRFRDHHQSDTETDIQYTARVNGFSSVDELVLAHSSAPFIVTFPCFKPGNTESVQLVERSRQIQAPKYLRPRTDTPARAVAHGGAFTVVYPTRGVGGYQLLGRSPVPVVDLTQSIPGFETSMVLTRAASLLKFRVIDGDEYRHTRECSKAGHYEYRRRPVTFELARYLQNPDAYAAALTGHLR